MGCKRIKKKEFCICVWKNCKFFYSFPFLLACYVMFFLKQTDLMVCQISICIHILQKLQYFCTTGTTMTSVSNWEEHIGVRKSLYLWNDDRYNSLRGYLCDRPSWPVMDHLCEIISAVRLLRRDNWCGHRSFCKHLRWLHELPNPLCPVTNHNKTNRCVFPREVVARYIACIAARKKKRACT